MNKNNPNAIRHQVPESFVIDEFHGDSINRFTVA
jgi:hypothetical protein